MRVDAAAIATLLPALEAGVERADAAWPQLREALRAEPGPVSALLCGWLEERLSVGASPAHAGATFWAIRTYVGPRAVPVHPDVLRRLLSHAPALGPLTTLCAAELLARVQPAGIIAPGILEALGATDVALSEPADAADDPVQPVAKAVATSLWRALGAGDPASLVPLLELWAEQVGWQRPATHLLAETLLEALPRTPSLIPERGSRLAPPDPIY